MIFLLLTCVIRDARPPADETRGNVHLRHRHCPEAAKEKQNTRNQRPTCPVYMIAADARSVWEGSPHTTKGSIARTLTCRSALQSRIESHGHKSASIAAPGDILFLSPKNQICVFPQAGLLTQLHRPGSFSVSIPMVYGLGSTSQQRSCRRLALRSLFSLSPAWYQRTDDRAPVNTRVFCCA